MLTLLAACSVPATSSSPTAPVRPASGLGTEHVLDVLTYNIAGLPGWISRFDGRETHPKIGAALGPFDLVLLQEDFWYQEDLNAEHPWRVAPRQGALLRLGDGLARMSRLPLSSVEHVAWKHAHGLFGAKHDRWALKGFAVGKLLLGGDLKVWVYNLHCDAGWDPADVRARALQRDQLIADIAERTSPGDALLVAGDFNCGPDDLERQTQSASMIDTGVGGIDRILLRSGARVELQVDSSSPEPPPSLESFIRLSDHFPVWLRLRIRGR